MKNKKINIIYFFLCIMFFCVSNDCFFYAMEEVPVKSKPKPRLSVKIESKQHESSEIISPTIETSKNLYVHCYSGASPRRKHEGSFKIEDIAFYKKEIINKTTNDTKNIKSPYVYDLVDENKIDTRTIDAMKKNINKKTLQILSLCEKINEKKDTKILITDIRIGKKDAIKSRKLPLIVSMYGHITRISPKNIEQEEKNNIDDIDDMTDAITLTAIGDFGKNFLKMIQNQDPIFQNLYNKSKKEREKNQLIKLSNETIANSLMSRGETFLNTKNAKEEFSIFAESNPQDPFIEDYFICYKKIYKVQGDN